jgi:hypothetical protein
MPPLGSRTKPGIPWTSPMALALAALALTPAIDRVRAARAAKERLAAVVSAGTATCAGQSLAVRLADRGPLLASWQTVGGCGAGGGSASAPGGGIKWVGRNVTGGLVDSMALVTSTYARNNRFTTVLARFSASPAPRWGVALNVPVLYKGGDVTVLGATRRAGLAGFGDLSVEASYKLGAIRSHQLSLFAALPTGSSDAVRQGVVLPQHLQLGSGVPGVTVQYEHTQDHDWGLVLLGGTATYAGWTNGIGDFRSPSATAYAHAGYLLGPWVPSAGLTLFAKPTHDRERFADRPHDIDPLFLVAPSLGLEWSTSWIAVLPAATLALSYKGLESVSFGIGVSSSLF